MFYLRILNIIKLDKTLNKILNFKMLNFMSIYLNFIQFQMSYAEKMYNFIIKVLNLYTMQKKKIEINT